MASLVSPSSTRIVQFEVPQEAVYSLEGWSYSENLVHDVFETDDPFALATQMTLNGFICHQGNTASVDFEKTALVDKSANGFERGVSPGDVGFGNAEHIQRSLVDFHKGGIIDLTKPKQLQDLPWLGRNSVDTKEEIENN